jgi:hypothetical protein
MKLQTIEQHSDVVVTLFLLVKFEIRKTNTNTLSCQTENSKSN